MGKLTEKVSGIKEKWKALSKGKKITIISAIIGTLLIIAYICFSVFRTEYAVLFSNLDSKDSGSVIDYLKEQNIDYKVQGNSIMVPKQDISKTRMETLSKVDFKNGSVGLELFESDSMVLTDFENNVKYQRALQGEIELMIKSFEEVENCKVLLKLVEKDTFAIKESTEAASAAIYIKLKSGVKSLQDNQVKAIVSLVTGAVPNIQRENVNIAVNDIQLVTDKLFDDEEDAAKGQVSTDKQREMINNKEESMKEKVLEILKPVYGSGVKVSVNVDLNFNAVQTDSKNYSPGVVVSENIIETNDKNKTPDKTTSSPVDNNLSPVVVDGEGTSTEYTYKDETRNYQVPSVNRTEVEAPGKINKINISVAIDETKAKLDDLSRLKIEEAVMSAAGIDKTRGDTVSIQGFVFADSKNPLMDEAKNQMNSTSNQNLQKTLERNLIMAILGIILLIVMLVVYKKVWGKKDIEEDDVELDEIMESVIQPKGQEDKFEPIVFESETPTTHMESEVKKYAQNQPEQVVDIVKSWLAEDER